MAYTKRGDFPTCIYVCTCSCNFRIFERGGLNEILPEDIGVAYSIEYGIVRVYLLKKNTVNLSVVVQLVSYV